VKVGWHLQGPSRVGICCFQRQRQVESGHRPLDMVQRGRFCILGPKVIKVQELPRYILLQKVELQLLELQVRRLDPGAPRGGKAHGGATGVMTGRPSLVKKNLKKENLSEKMAFVDEQV